MSSLPGDFEIHLKYGELLSRIGHDTQATEHFDKAAEICPEDGRAIFQAAQARMKRQQYETALEGFTKTIKVSDEPDAMLYICQAEAQTKVQDYESAMESAQSALKVDPGNKKATSLMGKLMVMKGSADDAITMLSEAVRGGEKRFVVLFSLACALQDKALVGLSKWSLDLKVRPVQQEEFRETMEEAIKTYKAALVVDQNGQAACNLATALLGLRNGRKTEIELEQDDIKRASPAAPTEQELATIREQMIACGGQFKTEISGLENEALEYLDLALGLNEQDLLAQVHHASLLLEMNKPQTAITSYLKGIKLVQSLAEMQTKEGKLTNEALAWIGKVLVCLLLCVSTCVCLCDTLAPGPAMASWQFRSQGRR